MRCLITGCALQLQHSPALAWGDLHLLGESFIFDGTLDRDGRLFWAAAKTAETKALGEKYFERRGVLVCRADMSLLNEAARAYVERWA